MGHLLTLRGTWGRHLNPLKVGVRVGGVCGLVAYVILVSLQSQLDLDLDLGLLWVWVWV